jgi:superfamily II DNA/RNA helicase
LRPSAAAYAERSTQQSANESASAPYTTFESLNHVISRPILDNIINRMGLQEMTEVQSKTVTAALQGVDM